MPSRIHLVPTPLEALVGRFGGRIVSNGGAPREGEAPELGDGVLGHVVAALAPIAEATRGALVPLLRAEYVHHASSAVGTGAVVVAAERLEARLGGVSAWVHPEPSQVIAALLAEARVEDTAGPPGAGCEIHPTAVVYPCVRIGARVRIGPYAVVGAPGFGFVPGPDGLVHVPQLGGVVVEDDVWIGAHTTIDAGTLGPTRVRRGAKLDAHVHVGHNADVGADAVLCAQVGLAGSVRIGRGAVLGGQAGVADHVTIGEGARIAAKAGVIGHVPAGAVVAGYPAVGHAKWLRGLAATYRATTRRPPPRTP